MIKYSESKRKEVEEHIKIHFPVSHRNLISKGGQDDLTHSVKIDVDLRHP